VEKRHSPLLAWYGLTSVFSLIVLGIGIYLAAMPPHTWSMLAAGAASLVALGVTWPLARIVASAKVLDNAATEELLQPLTDRLDQMSILMNLMSEQQLLSDRAKVVAFREKDREALRRAINEEMSKQDWEAAFALADDVERTFGYRAEAERLRNEIRNKRQEGVRKQINEVVAVIDRHTRAEQWNGAMREAEKLMTMFPDNEQVKNLPHEIDARRQAHKKQLLQSWQEAVARHDVDGSIEILRQLDPYLTPAEAEGMQETARGVFKEKLNNLGAQFSNSIRDHNWPDAIKTGEQIIRDFPNSRAAQEVKEKMDALRQRSVEPAGAPAPATV
jgi:hypothetical protein